MLFFKMKVKTMFLYFWCVLCEMQHLKSLYLDLVFLKSLGSCEIPQPRGAAEAKRGWLCWPLSSFSSEGIG